MDFTDLIDWGKSSRFSCNQLPLPATVLHETIRFIIVYSTWSIYHFKWDVFKAMWAPFHFLRLSLKNLNTVGNSSLQCTSQKTTDFWLMIVETTNLTLHTQTIYGDNWQIPWWNEMLCTGKVTSVFDVCLAKKKHHFDVLPNPSTKIHSFCKVNSFLIFQATIGTLGNWSDPWHVDISFGEINQNLPANREHEMCQMKLLKSKVFMGLVLEYLSSKWNISGSHTNRRRTNQDFFRALLVRGNTQGKLLLSVRPSLFSGALMWKLQMGEFLLLIYSVWH